MRESSRFEIKRKSQKGFSGVIFKTEGGEKEGANSLARYNKDSFNRSAC